jgi:hypothetical protein
VTLEKQYLVEYETKLSALQLRLDEYWPEMPPKSLVQEFYRLLDIINRLKKEVES